MKIIEFFGLQIKPRITKGKHMFKPLETGKISKNLWCIKDKDVNCFLYKTKTGYLAIDSGYKKSQNIRQGLEQLQISREKVHTVFLTHLDIDHAGGMDADAKEIFPNATIYLSTPENEYLKGTIFRKQIGPIACKMPIRLKQDRILLDDHEIISCDGVEVEAIYTPGHSAGHTTYRIGKNLFVGDCIISDGMSGWCFYDFWNWNTDINKHSLQILERYAKENKIKRIITSHSGILSCQTAFLHRDTAPNWKEKGFQLIPDAPNDPYQ